MIYLIGVNHVLQYDSASHNLSKIVREKRASFQAHVLEVVDNLGISILAEEFNDEAKQKTALLQSVSKTTLECIAKDKRIEHRFCGATSMEKKEHGIAESDSDKREQFWLSRIQDCKNKNVLFVCGDDHFDSFAEKLTAADFDVKRGPTWRISDDEWSRITNEIVDAWQAPET